MPYIPWCDHRGGRLELSLIDCTAPAAGHLAAPPEPGDCLTIDAGDFHLPPGKLPEFVGTLYEAAGQPLPIVLPRPQMGGTTSIFLGGYSVMRDPGAVTVLVGTEERRLTPAEAREYAAAVAARADEAEAEKSEAAVLADLIIAVTASSGHGAAQLARTILRAGYKPPERTP